MTADESRSWLRYQPWPILPVIVLRHSSCCRKRIVLISRDIVKLCGKGRFHSAKHAAPQVDKFRYIVKVPICKFQHDLRSLLPGRYAPAATDVAVETNDAHPADLGDHLK